MHNHFFLYSDYAVLPADSYEVPQLATNQYIHSLATYQPLSHQQLQGLPQPHTLILLMEYYSGQHTHELYQHPQIQYTQMC